MLTLFCVQWFYQQEVPQNGCAEHLNMEVVLCFGISYISNWVFFDETLSILLVYMTYKGLMDDLLICKTQH